ncbi:MAG TPA: hypothetical protein VMT96_00745 [Candidatus Bathyarchaeia archaeon]|nr:hypothetical protein [Candidatus Bathyarchaeia archaeon]
MYEMFDPYACPEMDGVDRTQSGIRIDTDTDNDKTKPDCAALTDIINDMFVDDEDETLPTKVYERMVGEFLGHPDS